MSDNKQIVDKSKTILDGFGYQVKTGHLYEMFSQLSGFKSWNVAGAKDVKFENLVPPTQIQPQKFYQLRNNEVGIAYIDYVKGDQAIGKILINQLIVGGEEHILENEWNIRTGLSEIEHVDFAIDDLDLVAEITDPKAIANYKVILENVTGKSGSIELEVGKMYETRNAKGATAKIYESHKGIARGVIFVGMLKPIKAQWDSNFGNLIGLDEVGDYVTADRRFDLVEEIKDPDMIHTLSNNYKWKS